MDRPNSELLGPQSKQQFLEHRAKTHEDWQVKHAEHALRLYAYFLSSQQSEASRDDEPANLAWIDLENRARKSCRCRPCLASHESTSLVALYHVLARGNRRTTFFHDASASNT